MKFVRLSGLASAALIALLMASASASATELTSTGGSTPTLQGQAEKHVLITGPFGTFGSITCLVSSFKVGITNHGSGIPVSGSFSSLTFSSCTGGSPTTPVAKPGKFWVNGITPTGDGTVIWDETEIIVHETAVGKCVFKLDDAHIGRLTGSSTTGGTATLDLNGTLPADPANPFCGSKSTIEGSYTIPSPATLNFH